jgi:hypothetical protein
MMRRGGGGGMTVSVYERHLPTLNRVTFQKVRRKSNFVQVRFEYTQSRR